MYWQEDIWVLLRESIFIRSSSVKMPGSCCPRSMLIIARSFHFSNTYIGLDASPTYGARYSSATSGSPCERAARERSSAGYAGFM